MRAVFSRFCLTVCLLSVSLLFGVGCSAETSKKASAAAATVAAESSSNSTTSSSRGPTIEIKPNSPADTVRAFYTHLRGKRFRDAIFLTNLRPAIEGLTDTELKEFQLDFEAIAIHVPAQIEIKG